MKRVLLASTFLVVTSGLAQAQVALTGMAEIGISYVEGYGGPDDGVTQFHQDIDVTFTMSGETDGGLTFGASIDLDEAEDLGAPDAGLDDGGFEVFISGNFGTVTMGDTDGALDWAITDAGNIGNPGSLNDNETGHVGYNGSYLDGVGDGQIVRYEYTFDNFRAAVSVEQSDPVEEDDLTWAIGFGYQFEFAGGAVDLGIGYQSGYAGGTARELGDSDIFLPAGTTSKTFAISATVTLDSGLSAGAQYATYNFSNDEEVTHIGIGAGYSFDAFSVHANYGRFERDDGHIATGYGLAAGYDLGGGASLLFGYGDSRIDRPAPASDFSASTYSLGLSFSF